jgi:hypothetical protein
MFKWLRRKADEREIYHYQDGTKERRVDPLELHNRIEGDEQIDDWKAVAKRAFDGERDAILEMVGLIRRAFQVEPFNEQTGAGLTMVECINLFDDWLSWIQTQKKSFAWLPIRSRPLAMPPLPDQSTTSRDAACTSMPTGSPTGGPTPCYTPSAVG